MDNHLKGAVAYQAGEGYLISKQGVVLAEMFRRTAENGDGSGVIGHWILLDGIGNIMIEDQYRNDIAELYEFTFRR